MRAFSVRRVAALCASLIALAALPASAAATSSQVEVDAAIDKAVEYMRPQQEAATGAIPGFGGDSATTSLVAAGVDAGDFRLGPGDPSLQDFVLGEYTLPTWDDDPPLGTVAQYSNSILISHAAGLDPARLSASSNQPAQLAGRWNPALGSFGEASANNTAFAILALKTTPVPGWALEPAVSFLRRNQHDDGGWTYSAALTPAARAEPSEEDMTGAAIAALCEAGAPAYDADVAAALGYLRGRLADATGGIQYLWGAPNSDTNAWVVSGLNACGIDPQSAGWTTSAGKTPVDFLLSLQVPSGTGAGGFGYEDTSSASLYSTQDALRAIAGAAFGAAPQSVRPAPAVAAGTPAPHLLAIELAPGNVRLCKVTAAAGASLTEVLAAAKTGSHPAGCVTSLAVAGGEVQSIDGMAPAGADEAWLLRLDRGSETAAAEQPVGFGDVIALRLGRNPVTAVGPAGRQGTVGAPGLTGAPGPSGSAGRRGRRGLSAKPARHANKVCTRRGRRAGKHRRRCIPGHSRGHRKGAGATAPS
jgi:hypothetical protein